MKLRCPYCRKTYGPEPKPKCPSCGKSMRVPENLLDEDVRKRRAERRLKHRQADRHEPRQQAPNDTFSEKRPLLIVGLLAILIVAGVLLAGRSTVELRPAHQPDVKLKAQSDLQALRVALERFRYDCKRYPTTKEGLRALIYDRDFIGWRGVYVNLVRPDPWRRPYVYESDGYSVALFSLGADGTRGTEDDIVPVAPTLEQVAGASNYWSIRPAEQTATEDSSTQD